MAGKLRQLFLTFLLPFVFYGCGPIIAYSVDESAEFTKDDIDSAIDYLSKIDGDDFPIFANLIRTYKTVPAGQNLWPEPNSPVRYLGGAFASTLSFVNITMLVHNGDRPFEELAESSRAHPGYIQLFKDLHDINKDTASTCYFERYIARERWVTKGVIIADLTKSDGDQQQLLIDCASAGADFINGLPFASHRAAIADMPSPRTRAAINNALYRCSLKGSTNIAEPEKSRDGLSERPSRSCISDYLKSSGVKQEE